LSKHAARIPMVITCKETNDDISDQSWPPLHFGNLRTSGSSLLAQGVVVVVVVVLLEFCHKM